MSTFDVHELEEHGCTPGIVALVREAQQAHPVVKLASSSDRKSVPLMGSPDTQVALYPMRRRVAIALPPELASGFASRLGVPLEKKSAQTHYLHLRDEQLLDPARRAAALEAALTALSEMSKRHQGQRTSGQHAEDEAPEKCADHPWYRLNANGTCPQDGCE